MTNPFLQLIPLPKGIDIERIGTARADEFEYYGDKILKGTRPGHQVVVKPQEGYQFAFMIEQNCYMVRKIGTAPSEPVPALRDALATSEVKVVAEPEPEPEVAPEPEEIKPTPNVPWRRER